MGWWTRSNPEYCLLGMKGSPKREAKNVHSIIETKIEEHSKKPSEVRDKIVLLCGDKPRIELFSRQKVDGWDAWGNEFENDVEIQNVKPNMETDVWQGEEK